MKTNKKKMSKKKSLEPGVEEELYVFSQDMTKVFHVVFSKASIKQQKREK